MSISSRITAMIQHLEDDYEVLELAGADLTNVNKNIENLKSQWKDRLKYYLSNGLDVVWNNWDKVTGSGTTLSLTPTIKGKMEILLKGNTIQETSILPDGYTQVEYIESDGTQYIDTGITSITKSFAIEIDFSIITSQSYQAIYCCRTDNTYTRSCFATGLTGFRNDQGWQNPISKSLSLDQKYKLESTETKFIVDGTALVSNITTSQAVNSNMRLLGAYPLGGSTLSYPFYGKLYGCKMWDNNTLIRDFVPCYRNSDIEIGLYDLVNDVFYPNNGTGTFGYGSMVGRPIRVVSGDNKIKICGKNLFDKDNIISGYRLDGSGNASGSASNEFTSAFIEVESGETYIRNYGSITAYTRTCFYDENKTFISKDDENQSVVVPSNAKYIRFCDYLSRLDTMQLEKGSTATAYAPYQSQTYSVNLKGRSNNLVQTVDIYNGYPNRNIGSTINYNSSANSITYKKCAYVEANKTYTLSFSYQNGSPKVSATRDIVLCDDNAVVLEYYSYSNDNNNKSKTFTTNYNGWIYVTLDAYAINVMVNEGSSALPYEPYQSNIELCKIGNYQDYIRKSTGKNLFDKNVELKNAYPSITVGSTVSYTNSSATVSYVNGAYVKANTQYTISWNQSTTPSSTSTRIGVIVDESNKVSQTQNTWINDATSITFTPTTSGYLIVCADKNATDYQLELGTATSYEPHGKVWYKYGAIGKVVLDGSETWNIVGGMPNDLTAFSYQETTLMSLTDGYCNNNPWLSAVSGTQESVFKTSYGSIIYVIEKSRLTDNTEAAFKTWLSSNNAICYVPLITPTYTKIVDETTINQLEKAKYSCDSQTNISQTPNDLPFELDVIALKEM